MSVTNEGGNMSSGHNEDGLLERDCGSEGLNVPAALEEDIDCAARSDVPVLITGDPDDGREIACAIDRRSPAPKGSVEVVDCRQYGALGRVMSYTPRGSGASDADGSSILLLQEVHALSRHEQAEFEDRLEELRVSRRDDGIRIMASSSAPLFERVRDGSFDERLFYRLNVIHMVVA
jgi:DNA-binding NtrC family response regulator